MRTSKNVIPLLAAFFAAFHVAVAVAAQPMPNGAAIAAAVSRIMTQTRAKGMAVAVVDRGKACYVQAYGIRNAK